MITCRKFFNYLLDENLWQVSYFTNQRPKLGNQELLGPKMGNGNILDTILCNELRNKKATLEMPLWF